MNLTLNQCIEDVERLLLEMADRGRRVRKTLVLNPSLDIRPEPKPSAAHRSEIVLKSDTALELGHPSCGSCAMILYGEEAKACAGDLITLVGPDVEEEPSGQLPFGQVILIRDNAMTDADFHEIVQKRPASTALRGYMVRSTSEQVWTRVSHDAVRRGFSFEVLGTALIQHVRSLRAGIKTVDIIFVTSSRHDVAQLAEIAKRCRDAFSIIQDTIWQQRGIDIQSCAPGAHCGACDDEQVCLEIRKISADRKRTTQAKG